MQETEYINVYGARVHNLKDIDAEIPRDSLTVITGLSGSWRVYWWKWKQWWKWYFAY